MAINLELEPVDSSIGIGKVQQFVATITDAPVDSTTAYEWYVDDEVQTETTATFNYTANEAGTKTIKVKSTTKAEGAEDVVLEKTGTLVVELDVMVITVLAQAEKTDLTIGDTYKASCNVTGQPEGSTIDYLWSTGETTKDVSKKVTSEGEINLTCKVTVKHSNYQDAVKDSNVVKIFVNKKAQTTTLSVSADPSTVKVGKSYIVKAETSKAPANATFTYLWDSGEKTSEITKTGEAEGLVSHSVTVTIKSPDYEDSILEGSVNVTVASNEPDPCTKYIHPLDHRESAYLWQGWWVMEEIEKAVEAGIDWKNPDNTELNYKCDLKTLAYMIDTYPSIEVQESKNGYILNKTTIESGYIY